MTAPVFFLQIYLNITIEYRLGRELHKLRRYNGTAINEK